MKILKPRITYLAFIECELRGKWQNEEDEMTEINGKTIFEERHTYFSLDKNCELWLVQLNGVRKAFVFAEHCIVQIVGTTVKFNQEDIQNELTIDEDKQINT